MFDLAALLSHGADANPKGATNSLDEVSRLVQGVAGTSHPWPAAGPKSVELHYAVYLEPGGEPFWALNPRFYWIFDLKWPTKPAVWTEYHPLRRKDGHIVGDPAFPKCDDVASFSIGAMVDSNIIKTHVPGELMVGFEATVSEKKANDIVSDTIGGRIIRLISKPGNAYLVSCRPFGAPEDAVKLAADPEVRYAECNYQVSLITPGGWWRKVRLV